MFIPYKQKPNKGKGKGSKGPKRNNSVDIVEMAHQKSTLTKAKRDAIDARNRQAAKRAKKLAEEAAKNVPPPPSPKSKPRKTDPNTGKGPRNLLKARAARKATCSGH